MVSTSNRKNFNDDDWVTPFDIAEYLQISHPTAVKLLRQGDIIGGRIGGRWRAYFKYVREYEEKTFRGGVIQRSLPLTTPQNVLKPIEVKPKKAVKKKRP
jgi:excisionase family DNA binding protein